MTAGTGLMRPDVRARRGLREPFFVSRSIVEQAAVREMLMGAQDNLTNVLAVMIGVSIGAGRGTLLRVD
jgi:hypothetical protein